MKVTTTLATRVRVRTVQALLAIGLISAALFVGSAPAQAANGIPGVRQAVCAQDLFVRTAPLGPWMGTLYYGQTFLTKEVRGSWVYGFAYGNINRHGWVQNGWFC